MKKVLITGKDSYVGAALAGWLSQWPADYVVDTLEMREPAWRGFSFRGYDAVFHVAGIVHQPKAPRSLYYQVNRDLAIEAAQKAKGEGVGQFILMSTMAVFGVGDRMRRKNEIKAGAALRPKSAYGKSKKEAESGIMGMQGEGFAVCIVRAPMVYGANCPGNYGSLRRLAVQYGLGPLIENARSMIYVGNLCAFVRLLIDRQGQGFYHPQDSAYMCTAEVMAWIAMENGRPFRKSKLLAWAVKCLAPVLPGLRKAFGSLAYAYDLSAISPEDYCRWSPQEAIKATEAAWHKGT